MKKTLSLLVTVLLLSFCLVGCTDHSNESFYGVVRFSERINGLIVYIPEYGEVEIPENKGFCTCFDGHGDDDSSYHLKPGDLVEINFEYDDDEDNRVQIMESYPARFDRKAGIIEVLKQDIYFNEEDGEYVLSFPENSKTESTSVGDTLYFVFCGIKPDENGNCYEYEELHASGEITDKSDGIITTLLTIYKDEEKFLVNYAYYISIETSWKKQ